MASLKDTIYICLVWIFWNAARFNLTNIDMAGMFAIVGIALRAFPAL